MTDTRHPGLITPGNAPRLADLDDDTSPYPKQLTITCDGCPVEDTADYLVPADSTKAERFEIARDHLRTVGWSCTDAGDWCPGCAMLPVLAEVRAEHVRQIAKWGVQHREDGADPFTYRDIAVRARENFQNAEANGGATWHRTLDRPFFEAISRTDPAALRAALVEVAAVACAWIQDIDSRTAGA